MQLKVGNRDLYGFDFKWIDRKDIKDQQYHKNVLVLERREYGNFYGVIKSINSPQNIKGTLDEQFEAIQKLLIVPVEKLVIISDDVYTLNIERQKVEKALKVLIYQKTPTSDDRHVELTNSLNGIIKKFKKLVIEQASAKQVVHSYTITMQDAGGRKMIMPVHNICRYYYANDINAFSRSLIYASKIRELFSLSSHGA